MVLGKELSRTGTFGARLTRARMSLKLSQEALAENVGTTARSIHRWEHNYTFPQQYYRERLCEALHIAPEELFVKSSNRQQIFAQLIPLWYVPHMRNPSFTGHEAHLYRIYKHFHGKYQRRGPLVLSGPRGTGKTQLALEYAYRFRDNYQAVLWVRAHTHKILTSDCLVLAHFFQLPERDGSDPILLKEAVKRWFCTRSNWLLIFDHVNDLERLFPILPNNCRGHIIITTRSQIRGMHDFPLNLEEMELAEGNLAPVL